MAGNISSSLASTSGSSSLLMVDEDFDFNKTCRYFKSSFARTLSLNNGSNNNCCRSLDFDILYQDNSNSNNNNNNNNNNNHMINDHIRIINGTPTKNDYGLNNGGVVGVSGGLTATTTTNMDIDAKNEVEYKNIRTTTTRNQNKIMQPTTTTTIENIMSNNNNNNNNNNNINNIDHKQPQSLPLMLTQQQQQQQQQREHQTMSTTHFKPVSCKNATATQIKTTTAATTTNGGGQHDQQPNMTTNATNELSNVNNNNNNNNNSNCKQHLNLWSKDTKSKQVCSFALFI